MSICQPWPAIPGVTCLKPRGALYAFPRLDPNVHDIRDDARLVYDFLVAEHVLLVQGTGFNWPTPDHLRIVTRPPRASVNPLAAAVGAA